MANHCTNTISVTGDTQELKRFYDFFKSHIKEHGMVDIEGLLGYSLKDKDVYNEAGTRWIEINYMDELNAENQEFLSIGTSSAWSPPLTLFRQLSEKFKLNFTIKYEESGNDFGGSAEIVDGVTEDYCYGYWENKFLDDYHWAANEMFEEELAWIAEDAEDEEELKNHSGFAFLNEEDQEKWLKQGKEIMKRINEKKIKTN